MKRQGDKDMRNPSTDLNDVMTLQAVAAFFNCHPSTVYRLVKAGKLPAFRLSGGGSRGDWRFLRSQLHEWMAGKHGQGGRRDHKPKDKAAGL